MTCHRPLKNTLMLACAALLPGLAPGLTSGLAQAQEVRLWSPFTAASTATACIVADVEDWMDRQPEALALPHRLVPLPEGRYADQLRAALATGEQPHLALADERSIPALDGALQGPFFGADVIGLWVDLAAFGDIPRAVSSFYDLWLSPTGTHILDVDDYLIFSSRLVEGMPLGLDRGADGQSLGLVLALMVEQWTTAFDVPDMPNWADPSVTLLFETLSRWHFDGLLAEVDLAADMAQGAPLPNITLARYSTGRALGADFAFYPLFSFSDTKPASFLELPVHWYNLRPLESQFSQALVDAAGAGAVLPTCAETAGLLSYQQFEDVGESTVMELFSDRQDRVFPDDLPVQMVIWTSQQPDLPGQLANVLRDMRAGLSVDNALRDLRAAGGQ